MPKSPVIILTRERADNASLRSLLAAEGAEVIDYPCIQTEQIPMDQWQWPGDHPPEDYRVLVFTSRHGVRAFAPAWTRLGNAPLTVAVVGSGTAAEVERRFGRRPDLVASPPTGEGLAARLLEFVRSGTTILWVRGSRSTGNFEAAMGSLGFKVSELVVYRNLRARLEPIPLHPPAVLVFASPSAAESFFQFNGAEWKECPCVAVGPTTAASLAGLGCKWIEKSLEPAPRALADCIVSLLREVN